MPRAADKQVFLVNADDVRGAEATLAAFLAGRLSEQDAALGARLAAGAVYVDGRRERDPAAALQAGQKVVVFAAPAADKGAATEPPAIAYRDRELAVIVKPAGLASTTPRRGARHTAESFVAQALGPGARLLHRLDQGASGLLLVSCRRASRAQLARQVSEHRLERAYLAVASGAPAHDELALTSKLAFDGHRARRSAGPGARPASSHVTVLRRLEGPPPVSLLQVELQTGRTHQIRAQLAEVGLPLLGDDRYGGPSAERLALHAHRLAVTHPDGRRIELHSPLPAAIARLLESPIVKRG